MNLFKLFTGSALFIFLSSISSAFAVSIPVEHIPAQCQKLFEKADVLVDGAMKQPGTHPNLADIRAKLDTSKALILSLEPSVQIKSCDLGLAKLNLVNKDTESLLN